MKAAVYRGAGRIEIEDLPVPEPARGEIVVRVEACGVCPTDIKKVQKGLQPPPRVYGHEIAGTVAQAGAGVSRFRPGQRVVLHHHIPCRSCFYCRHGAFAQCEVYKRTGTGAGFEPAGGGFAQYVKAFDWIVESGTIAVPDGVLAEEAAFVEPVNTCLKCVQHAGIGPGQTVLVVGQGPIGLLLLQLARWAGGEVVASDPLPDRRELSRALGAAAVLDPLAADVVAEVRALSSGRGADCTLLAAVGPEPFRQALQATRPAGRVVVFSATAPGEMAELDLGALSLAEKQILTSYSASVEVQELAARLVFERAVRVRELITHRLPLQQTARGVELASRPAPGVLKVVIEPQAGTGA